MSNCFHLSSFIHLYSMANISFPQRGTQHCAIYFFSFAHPKSIYHNKGEIASIENECFCMKNQYFLSALAQKLRHLNKKL